MCIAGEVNSELRRRFEQFKHYGAPGHYINLPHGFRAEPDASGEIVLYHTDCPSYPMRIGATAFSPYRWELGLNWDKAAGALVQMLGLIEPATEDVPF